MSRLGRARIASLFALLGMSLACENGSPPRIEGSELPVEWIRIGHHQISAEIARKPAERNRGLMFRESLPSDHGMLFVFQDERVRGFWMRNTPLPLSIAYADGSGRIVHIADLEPHDETPVSSRYPARYALEMRRDWFRDHAVFPGDRILGIPDAPAR